MKFVKNVLKTASLHIGIAFWLISCSDFVTPNRTQLLIVQSETSNAWASKIYPGDMFAQKVLISLVRIMKNHETNDPFNGGRSPGFDGFGLNRLPMGFYVDSTDTETDLLIFNWKDEVPAEFKDERALIDILGIPVYRVSKLPLEALATQSSVAGGANSFFSYLLGADQNFEPSADYLPKNHFLRKSLGNRMMPLCAPMSEWIDGQTLPYEKDPFLFVMDVMIHESYHLVESNWRRANDKQYSPNENADEMLAAIETPEFQQSLVVYYKSVVELMSMIDLPLPLNSFSKREIREAFGFVVASAAKLRALNAKAFEGFIFEEYSEGFAEFAASQTLFEMGIFTFENILDWHVDEKNPNPIFYRIGALGGLIMRATVGNFDWKLGPGYDNSSVWEKLGKSLNNQIDMPTEQALAAFSQTILSNTDMTKEIEKIKNYYK